MFLHLCGRRSATSNHPTEPVARCDKPSCAKACLARLNPLPALQEKGLEESARHAWLILGVVGLQLQLGIIWHWLAPGLQRHTLQPSWPITQWATGRRQTVSVQMMKTLNATNKTRHHDSHRKLLCSCLWRIFRFMCLPFNADLWSEIQMPEETRVLSTVCAFIANERKSTYSHVYV